MAENSKHFVLAHSFHLLRQDVLEKLGMLVEKEASQSFINKGVKIPEVSPVLSELLQLLCQLNPGSIKHYVSTD